MNVYHYRRPDTSIALYIDGNLQFDSRDEAVYHESLALPALCLARNPKRALICGGGDGLALREVLRFPGIEAVTLIDCSDEILEFARTELRELNQGALDDCRVTVIVADALEFPLEDKSFDVIVCDFTFPTTKESALGFTQEWYQKLNRALTEGGVATINAVSPQNTASAFACLVATVRAAGMKALPYRVCIPSFRDHGYGAWGFILASRRQLTIGQLRRIECPVATSQADLSGLAKGARFSAKSRLEFAKAPINRAGKPILQSLLLNPSGSNVKFSSDAPPDFPNLIEQVEITHPYHSRRMIEALAESVTGSMQRIDLRKLVDELSARAKQLPQRIVEELAALRDYLSRTVLDLDVWGLWASRLFATLILVMTIANSISPDPAFAKGHAGLGHASFSRGYSSHESFGGGSPAPSAPISGRGFTGTYGREPVDIYGYHYTPRIYLYDHYGGYGTYGGYGGYGSGRQGGPSHQPYQPQPHKPLFVLDDDLMAMENGDFVIPLSDTVFLVVADSQINLMDTQGGKPLMPLFAEPKLFQSIHEEVAAQGKDLDREVANRKDWLSWVGWTSTLFGSVKSDTDEYLNLQDLQHRLAGAVKRVGNSSESHSVEAQADEVELFVGCYVRKDNRITIYTPGGHAATMDGKTIVTPTGETEPLRPEMKAAIVSVLKKMIKESRQDIASDAAEYRSLQADQAATQRDLDEYQGIQFQYSYDPTYEVDYGTESIPVGQAINRTNQDLQSILFDQATLESSARKSQAEMERFQSALQAWGE